MPERLNFICIGDRVIPPAKQRECFGAILDALAELSPVPGDVTVFDHEGGVIHSVPWAASAGQWRSDGTVYLYFSTMAGSDPAAPKRLRHNISIEQEREISVLSISLSSDLFGGISVAPAAILASIGGWALQIFDGARLACGLELDLYEFRDLKTLKSAPANFERDWRCDYALSTHRTVRNKQ